MSRFSAGVSSFNIITLSITVSLCRYLHAQVAAVSIAHLDIKIMQRYNARQSRHTRDKGAKIVIRARRLKGNGQLECQGELELRRRVGPAEPQMC